MEFEDLVGLIAKTGDRDEFLRIGRALHQADARAALHARSTADEAEGRALLDELRRRLQVHFRAVRHPVPSDDELKQMVARHFTDDREEDHDGG